MNTEPAGAQGDQESPDVDDDQIDQNLSQSDMAGAGSTFLKAAGGSVGSAKLYDATNGNTLWSGELPFDTRVARIDVETVGDETYAIAGIRCDRIVGSSDVVEDCGPGGLSLSLFNSRSRTWKDVSAEELGSGTSYVDILGSHEGNIVVNFDDSILSIDSDSGHVGSFSGSPLDDFDLVCQFGNKVATVREFHKPYPASTGEVIEHSEPNSFAIYDSAVLNMDSGDWHHTGGPRQEYSKGFLFLTRCAGKHILGIPGRQFDSDDGGPYVTHRLNLQSGEWDQIPPPPVEFRLPGDSSWTDGKFVFPVTSGSKNQVLTLSEADTWGVKKGGRGGDVRIVAAAGDRLASLGWEEPGEQPQVSDERGVLPGAEPPPDPSHEMPQPGLEPISAPTETETLASQSIFIPAHEFNLCGARCNRGGREPADVVTWSVTAAAQKPWVVSLNEVCMVSQGWIIAAALDDMGYTATDYVALRNVDTCQGASYGNMVFTKGSRNASIVQQFSKQASSSPEKRGVACARSSSFLGEYYGCATHMYHDDASIAEKQADELYSWYRGTYRSSKVQIIAGDFNLYPGILCVPSAVFNEWRWNYEGIDEECPWDETTDDHVKLDYIWANDVMGISADQRIITSVGEASDHHYVKGRYVVVL